MARSKGLSFYKKKKKISSAVVREIFNWFFGIVVSVFIAGVLVWLFGMSIHVVGVSMEPTLYNEQKILVDRFVYLLSSPKQGDVVVFLPNGNENAHFYVKRVVGGPGDRIRIEEGVLYVNGLEVFWPSDKILDAGIVESEMTVPADEYFCIGDNPNNSEDSRSANLGFVHEDDIVGKAWFHLKSEETGMGVVK